MVLMESLLARTATQVCYEGVHAHAYVPSGLVVLGTLSLGPPIASYLILRGKPRGDIRVRKVRLLCSNHGHAQAFVACNLISDAVATHALLHTFTPLPPGVRLFLRGVQA